MVSATDYGEHLEHSFLRHEPEVLADAMAFVETALRAWFAGPLPHIEVTQQCDDILLVTCELLANACSYTTGPRRIELDRHPGHVRVAVTDPDPTALRAAAHHRPDQPFGHGLHIVDSVSLAWGCAPAPGGKTVWAELPAPDPPDRARQCFGTAAELSPPGVGIRLPCSRATAS